jgi:hypothetical protein
MCGLIGIPPSNGVIPQSPMHTKSLATLKYQVIYPEISQKIKVLSIVSVEEINCLVLLSW